MKLPTRAEKRARRTELRGQRSALRARIKADVAALKADPVFVKARARRRRRRAITAGIIIALILLLLRIDCADGPAPEPVASVGDVVEDPVRPKAPSSPKPKRKKRPLDGKLEGSGRAGFDVDAQPPPPWLAQFRLQVAARSPRLAACFNGAERPGALRWSALVHARSGRVTESEVEPVFRGVTLEDKQLDCLIKGLSGQPYVLDDPDPEAAPRRVSLIFEF